MPSMEAGEFCQLRAVLKLPVTSAYIPSFPSREAIAPQDGKKGKLCAQCQLSPLTVSSVAKQQWTYR